MFARLIMCPVVILAACGVARAYPQDDPEFKRLKISFARDMKQPGEPIVSVWVGSNDVTDADLKWVAGRFPDVRMINAGGKIKGDGLKHLSALPKLERLDLGFTAITDDGIKELVKLKRLKAVGLLSTKITDAGVKELTALAGLEELELGQNFNFTEKGINELAKLKKLRKLYLANSNASNENMKSLSALPELRTLVIPGTKVTDAGCAHIAKMPKL